MMTTLDSPPKTSRDSIMTKGISEQSKQLRRHLLNHNAPDVMKWMQESGMADPVGMIIEMTDDIGKQLTYAALEKQGMPRHEIPELIASYCKNAIPTFKCVVSFETAKKILPITPKPPFTISPPHANPASTGSSSLVVEGTAMLRCPCSFHNRRGVSFSGTQTVSSDRRRRARTLTP